MSQNEPGNNSEVQASQEENQDTNREKKHKYHLLNR